MEEYIDALGLPGTTTERKSLTSSGFAEGLRLQKQGVLFWLRKEQPHHPQATLLPFALYIPSTLSVSDCVQMSPDPIDDPGVFN